MAALGGTPKRHFPNNFHHQSELSPAGEGPPSPRSAAPARANMQQQRSPGIDQAKSEAFGARLSEKNSCTELEDCVMANPSDRATVMQAVARYGLVLKYAAPALRKDREVVTAAVVNNGWALMYADPQLRGDREICLRAVASQAQALQHCGPAIQEELSKGAVLFGEQEGARAVPLPEAPVIANWMRGPSMPLQGFAQQELAKLLASR